MRDEQLGTTIYSGHFAELGYLFGRHEEGSFEPRAIGLGQVLTAEKSLGLAHVSCKISTIDQDAVTFGLFGFDLDPIDQQKHIFKRVFKCGCDTQIFRFDGWYYFKIQF